MELKWLKTFVAVAEELNFRRAAERLFVAQPAVSQQIMSLERDLGVRLFERTKRSVRLTDAGAAFLPSCRGILADVDGAERRARNAGTGEYGIIRIGFNAGFTTNYMAVLVDRLRREHPNLELKFDITRTTIDVLGRLRDDQLDIALVGGPIIGTGVRRRHIGSTRLGVLLHESHPLSGADQASIEGLVDQHFIMVEATSGWSIRRLVQDELDRIGAIPAAVTTVSDAMTMLAFVAAGIGIGFASLNTQLLIPGRLALRPLSEIPEIPTSAVWMPANETPALQSVIAAIDAYLVEPDAAGAAAQVGRSSRGSRQGGSSSEPRSSTSS